MTPYNRAEWLLLALLLVPSISHSGTYKAEFLSAYDADTYKLRIKVWINTFWEGNVRLLGIDTPERSWRANCPEERLLADKARSFATGLLSASDAISVTIDKAGKFGRPLAIVNAGGVDMAAALIDAGYAYGYWGGEKRQVWCDR